MISNDIPEFFVPGAKNQEEAKKAWEAFRKFASENGFGKATNSKIFSLEHDHNSRRLYIEVGREHPITGELVLAILEVDQMYLIITRNRGGCRGEPILAGKCDTINIVDFDE